MLLKTDEFSKLVEKTMGDFKVPGLAIAIVEGDDIHVKEYGQAQLDGNACTTDTLFDCASTAKSFTSAVVALLVEDDKYPDVKWTTPVSKILGDDFVLADPMYTENVTIEDILSHRTGLPSHDESYLGSNAKQPDTAKSVTRNLRNLPIVKPLRTRYHYCNMMFAVATHLIETVTGESYSEFVKKRLWEPLDMLNTFHDVPNVEAADAMNRMATGYKWVESEGGHVGVPSYAQPEAQGAGCVFSSANDLAKWVRAMLHRSGPLSKSSHEELVRPRAIIPDEDDDQPPFYSPPLYALGWQVESYRGHAITGHDGNFSGFKASMRFLPKHDWGIVIFGNSDSAYFATQMILHLLMDDKLKVPVDDRIEWSEYWTKLYKEDQQEDKEMMESLSLLSVQSCDIPLEKLAGTYHNAGYHTLNLEVCDGELVANCEDRCMPFKLTFYLSQGQKSSVKIHWIRDGATSKMNADVRIDDSGEVTSIGIGFVYELKDFLIWFDKVACL